MHNVIYIMYILYKSVVYISHVYLTWVHLSLLKQQLYLYIEHHVIITSFIMQGYNVLGLTSLYSVFCFGYGIECSLHVCHCCILHGMYNTYMYVA